MKRSTLLVIATSLCSVCCVGQNSSATIAEKVPAHAPAFSIRVTTHEGPIHLGSPITAIVTVTNVSGKELYMQSNRGKDAAYKDFSIVLTKNEREVKTTFFKRKISGKQLPDDPQEVEDGSSIALPYPPGRMFVMTIDLERLYEITEPGLYKVDVNRLDDYSKTVVHSNTAIVKIE